MDARTALEMSKSFLDGYYRCMGDEYQPAPETKNAHIPAIVCLAFSVEVGFKSIILLEGKTAKGHNLYDLFHLLSTTSQQAIIQSMARYAAVFDNQLRSMSTAFEDWRYIYEGRKNNSVSFDFLISLSEGARQVAFGALSKQ